MSMSELRREYGAAGLDRAGLDDDPVVQFGRWFEQATAADLVEPNAMTLATTSPDGRPSARVVLLKGFGPDGFVFYSNYASRKGAELAANPHAALVFWWPPLERQVRIEGRVGRTSREESEAYWRSRPLGSRLSALASAQSRAIAGREELTRRVEQLAERHRDGDVPLPEAWGGYRLVPDAFEFWQGRSDRLHDRFRYTRREAPPGWLVERLSP
ncbi:MAG TPA: pyridoxamine 5'-phosphate oxidase [Actinomycetes bacterium]